MKLFKRVAAAVLALVLVAMVVKPMSVSASSVSVDAAELGVDWIFVEKDNQVKIILGEAGVDLAAVYGVRITFGDVDISAGAGGCIAYNTPSHGWWDAIEFGNEGANKTLTMVQVTGTNDYTLTLAEEKPIFTDADIAQRDDAGKALGCCFCLQQYWGANDLTVTKLEILGKDNVVMKTVPAPYTAKVGDKVDLAENATLENLKDGVQEKSMTLNGEVISGKVVGLKPNTDTTSKISYIVNVDKAGKYDLTVTYNAKGDNRPMSVKVNDGKAVDVALPSTSTEDYTTCGTKTIEVELKAGDNTITFSQASTFDDSNVKAPNLVFATVTAQKTTPNTGVATMVIPAAIVMLASGAVALKTSKKNDD